MNVTQKPHLHQDWIDPHATGIVRALQKRDFTTYLVGGCVRDLLLNIQPKDYDIATNAKPDEVKSIIHRAYVIGKRFRLVLVRREEQQFEVATFRRDLREDENRENLPEGDNIFGTAEEDSQRRDFTINALFYDPINDQLIDYAEGLSDLENRWVRMIGDPMKRLAEDPIRILRALRLKHMIGFALDPDLRKAMQEMASTLQATVLPRRREEILKLLRLPAPDAAFLEAYDLGILRQLSPTMADAMEHENGDVFLQLLRQIGQTDKTGLSPADWFGLLVHAYVRAFMQTDPGANTRAREVLDNEGFQKWMRDELGMFKFEQALAVKALHVESLLSRRKEFQKKGERRQRALLTNDAFPMALRFAGRDYCLSCEDHLYWNEKYERLKTENPMGPARPKRRRPRRPRRNGGGAAKAPASDDASARS
ncbi:MAG: poly(A) polymerase [Bdellovibrionales bacterium]|nr:poly(A) polymerase [Bdellovibrionales bacterium]